MKQAILDTDSVSYFFRGAPQVVEKVDRYLKEHGFINITVVTYYEVMNGLLYKDAKKQLARFEEFVRLNNVLPLTLQAATISAQVFAELRKTGKVIGHNNVLIAGIALEQDMVLITNNTSHFGRIEGLSIDNWTL
ncbi:MAG: type II toxin-antitoxin system VapC family toxin [Phaeodactylibacter sp.]|nr:type II toxin-antitoxin system VapC family toxin [Phaeodactylibacter sp.]